MTFPTVRGAVPADAAAARGVIERAIRVSAAGVYPADAVEAWANGRTVEALRRMIDDTDGFVAVVDRAIVGWANLHGDEVDQLYVDPDAGGQGVARRLYEAVEHLARDKGLVELRAVASLRAEPAFLRFGFREVARDERIFGGQTFAVVHMTKRLEEAGSRSFCDDEVDGPAPFPSGTAGGSICGNEAAPTIGRRSCADYSVVSRGLGRRGSVGDHYPCAAL